MVPSMNSILNPSRSGWLSPQYSCHSSTNIYTHIQAGHCCSLCNLELGMISSSPDLDLSFKSSEYDSCLANWDQVIIERCLLIIVNVLIAFLTGWFGGGCLFVLSFVFVSPSPLLVLRVFVVWIIMDSLLGSFVQTFCLWDLIYLVFSWLIFPLLCIALKFFMLFWLDGYA